MGFYLTKKPSYAVNMNHMQSPFEETVTRPLSALRIKRLVTGLYRIRLMYIMMIKQESRVNKSEPLACCKPQIGFCQVIFEATDYPVNRILIVIKVQKSHTFQVSLNLKKTKTLQIKPHLLYLTQRHEQTVSAIINTLTVNPHQLITLQIIITNPIIGQ